MRFNESKEWNMSHPSREIIVESDDYSILAMADIHVGTTDNLDRFYSIARQKSRQQLL